MCTAILFQWGKGIDMHTLIATNKSFEPDYVYTLSTYELGYLNMVAAQRQAGKEASGAPNRKIDSAQSDFQTNFSGVMGEYVACKYLGQRIDTKIYPGSDGGTDFMYKGFSVQVKATSQSSGKADLVFNHLGQLKTDIYILANITKVLTVNLLGWVTGDRFRAQHSMNDYGFGNRVCMGCTELDRMQELLGLGVNKAA